MPGTLLILGGGKVGRKVAERLLPEFDRVVSTCRNPDSSGALAGSGGSDKSVATVKFDMEDEPSWESLPPASEISAVVITFALSMSAHGSLLPKLFQRVVGDKFETRVLVISTSSVFDATAFKGLEVVSEGSGHPLEGKGVTGQSMVDRVEAEELCLSAERSGCEHVAVLATSGHIHNADLPDADILRWLNFRPMTGLVNLVPVEDIVSVVQALLLLPKESAFPHERLLVSAGAWRFSELAECLGVSEMCPPEQPPALGEIPKPSKVLSSAKIEALLSGNPIFDPKNNGWSRVCPPTSEGESLLATSRGLPMTPAHDTQWQLLKANFDGAWSGPSLWWELAGDGNDWSAAAFETLLKQPATFTSDSTNLNITFNSPDNGTWHGTGLRFAPGGEMVLPISRQKHRQRGGSFNFAGVGAQVSTSTEAAGVTKEVARAPMFGYEINFFGDYPERGRTMCIAKYGLFDGVWRLTGLGISPFRDGRLTQDLVDKNAPGIPVDLSALRGSPGTRSWWGPEKDLVLDEAEPLPVFQDDGPIFPSTGNITHAFAFDGIVVDIPAQFEANSKVVLRAAQLLGNTFRVVSLDYSGDGGELVSYAVDTYQVAK